MIFEKDISTYNVELQFKEIEKGERAILILRNSGCKYAGCKFCALHNQAHSGNLPDSVIINDMERIVLPTIFARSKMLKEIFFYNFGNVLDERNLKFSILEMIISSCCDNLQNLKTISMDNRIEKEYGFASDRLREIYDIMSPVTPEIGIGYEDKNEEKRNNILNKGLSEKSFLTALEILKKNGWAARIYLMLKPYPNMNDDEAVTQAIDTAKHLMNYSEKFNLPMRIHLNPSYVAKGTIMEQWLGQGIYSPPSKKAINNAYKEIKQICKFTILGLDNENLAVM